MFSFILDSIFGTVMGYLLADFLIGIYHWIKDTYFDPHTPVIGDLFIWNSRLHHIRPGFVTTFDDTEMFLSTAKWTLLWMGPLMYYVEFSAFTISLFVTICMNDVIHKYAHISLEERPYWATTMQNIGLFQTQEEHHRHHTYPHDTYYCPITPYLNGPLEKIHFWKKTEDFVERFIGIKPRLSTNEFVEDKHYPASIKFIKSTGLKKRDSVLKWQPCG